MKPFETLELPCVEVGQSRFPDSGNNLVQVQWVFNWRFGTRFHSLAETMSRYL